MLKPINRKNKYDNSGIYKLKCQTCHGLYIGQTGGNLKGRYAEHREIRNNKPQTGYSQHILDIRHEYGKLEDVMEIVEIPHKGSYLNTMEKIPNI
jgi:predicted GIY-YIG superfamily endonuclease